MPIAVAPTSTIRSLNDAWLVAPREDVGDRDVGEALRRAEEVDEEPAVLVGGDEPLPHLDAVHAVGARLDRELRAGRGSARRTATDSGGKSVLAALDHERHPSDDAVRVAGHAEVARRGRRRGERLEVRLRRVGLDERHRRRIGTLAGRRSRGTSSRRSGRAAARSRPARAGIRGRPGSCGRSSPGPPGPASSGWRGPGPGRCRRLAPARG